MTLETYLINVLLQIPDTAFTAVVLDKSVNGGGLQRHISILEARSFLSLRAEILVGNDGLLFRDVTANFEDFHTVEKWCGNSVEDISSADEEDPGKVNRYIHAEDNTSERSLWPTKQQTH